MRLWGWYIRSYKNEDKGGIIGQEVGNGWEVEDGGMSRHNVLGCGLRERERERERFIFGGQMWHMRPKI